MSAIAAVFGSKDAALFTYLMLYAQQHRGRSSAGIAWLDEDGRVQVRKNTGLVTSVFGTGQDLSNLNTTIAIAQVRWPTCGEVDHINAQPIVRDSRHGQIAVASDGNVTNAHLIKKELKDNGTVFASETSDTHVIPHLYARASGRSSLEVFIKTVSRLQGGYSLACLTPEALFLTRDPRGFRPLIIGRRDEGTIVAASETCAFDIIEAKFLREVNPGEILVVTREGITSHKLSDYAPPPAHRCLVELVSYARPDSVVFDQSVHSIRVRLGEELANEHPVKDADIVVPIPNSGFCPASGFATVLELPLRTGIVRNHYVNHQNIVSLVVNQARLLVRQKFNVVRSIVDGKKVVLVHSRVVKGHTSRYIIEMVRQAGAKEVHLRVSSPLTVAACHYGVGRPNHSELVATKTGIDALGKHLGADSLGFLSLNGLQKVIGGSFDTFCTACFTGAYPAGTRPE